jgi:hypothetical protein
MGGFVKKAIAIFIATALIFGTVPRKAHAGILEGALIGGAIGAVVGLTIELLKPKSKPMVEEAAPANSGTSAAQGSVPDSTSSVKEELDVVAPATK